MSLNSGPINIPQIKNILFFSCPEIKINSPVLNNQNLYHSLPEQYSSIKDTEEENGFILIDFLAAQKIPTKIAGILNYLSHCDYIIPGIPPPPPPIGGIGGVSSGISEITHSVVSNIPATEAAFSRATRTTLAGSITPAL